MRCSTITHISESPPPPPTNTVFWSVGKTPAAPSTEKQRGGRVEVEEILRVAIPGRCVIPHFALWETVELEGSFSYLDNMPFCWNRVMKIVSIVDRYVHTT